MRHFNLWDLLPLWQEILFIVVVLASGSWTWFKFRHASSWPSAQGTITGTAARTEGHSSMWVGELTYTYVAEGQYYSGLRSLRARSKRRAEEKIEGWKGRMIVVRYSPRNHEISTVLKSDQPGGQLGN
jgi:hypothetical protein